MVLEIKVPQTSDWEALYRMTPKFFSYVLSYLYVGIYWNNHHHTLHAIKKGTKLPSPIRRGVDIVG